MMIPTIETERLRLRGWQERDFPAYAAYRADAKSQMYLGDVMTRDQAWDRFCVDIGVWGLRGYGIFAIADLASDEAIGYTGIWHPLMIDEPELSWSLFPGHTGQGYASEAALGARSWLYRSLNLPPMMSLIAPGNHASKAVARRLGAILEREFMLEGELRHLYRHPK
ncbi:MAG: GNAT family N-acetyltransferase [Pseudomonadota bacterium]